MRTHVFWDFQTEVDENTTKDWYANASAWSCECGYCRNFLALAQKKLFPAPVLDALGNLGISPEKATYVCGIHPEEDGLLYQFSYRIAGNVLSPVDTILWQAWGGVRCCHESYPYGAPGFPTPHFDLEFWITLPWVLEDDPVGN